MLIFRFVRKHLVLVGLALFALGWIVTRACLQSVTIDEADSYLLFGTGPWAGAWAPSSGNHVLNTILFRLAIGAFGLHEWTLRLPAMLGAGFYVGSALYLCAWLTRSLLLQVTVFVCLVFNPLVLDYLVAARGYSLAIGFLLAAIALLADVISVGPRRCALASALLGLSFCANFSFAIADSITMLLFVLTFVRKRSHAVPLAAACFLPGIAVALALCGRTLLRYPKEELHFGYTTLREVWRGLATASFYELNRAVFPARLEAFLSFIPGLVPPLAVVLAVLLLARAWRDRLRTAQESLALYLAAVVLTTLLLHWVAFQALHILLPKDRTGLFFVPLFTLSLGAVLAAHWEAARKDTLRLAACVVLAVGGAYFLGCLRLTYFKEWKYNADTRSLYWVVNDLNRRCGVQDFFIEWHYTGSLNFYRAVYHNDILRQFASGFMPFPPNRRAYVYWFYDGVEFARKQALHVIYFNPNTLASVATGTCEGDKL